MDIRFEEKPNKEAKPNTRLYAPTKDGEKRKPRSARTDPAEERTTRREEPRVRVEKAEIKPLSRFGLILSGFLLAGMILFTLSGYERISRAYADINTINNEIEQTKLRIKELDVQIECAVTIQDAQEIAAAYHMQYPQKEQYRTIGNPWDLPAPTVGTAPGTGDAPQETDPNDDAAGGGVQPPEDG